MFVCVCVCVCFSKNNEIYLVQIKRYAHWEQVKMHVFNKILAETVRGLPLKKHLEQQIKKAFCFVPAVVLFLFFSVISKKNIYFTKNSA